MEPAMAWLQPRRGIFMSSEEKSPEKIESSDPRTINTLRKALFTPLPEPSKDD